MADDTDAETDATRTEPPAETTPIQDVVEAAAQVLDDEVQARLWLRALTPILQLRGPEPEPEFRGKSAFERMYNAACDRACRIIRADQDEEPPRRP